MAFAVPAEVPGMSKSPLITISVRAGSSATVSVTVFAPTSSVRTRPSVTGESSVSVAPSSMTIEFAVKSVYVPGAEAYAATVFAPLKVSVPGTCTTGMLPFHTMLAPEMEASCASSVVAYTITSFVEAAVRADARSA